MTIKWGPERPHDGSAECPAEAMDVPCMILEESRWLGVNGGVNGKEWSWKTVTAYRLPADVPAADPARDVLVASMTTAIEHLESLRGANASHMKIGIQFVATELLAALALAKGEKK